MKKQEIIALVKKREELYQTIKNKLKSFILDSIKKGDKGIGPKLYWNLFRELETTFGLDLRNYERIIYDLSQANLIEKNWIAALGSFLRIKEAKS